MCTYGTCSYSSVMLAIHHKSLHSVLSPSDVYPRDPSASDLWDPMAYVLRVLVEPFSISIRPVGPDGPMGPDGLRVTCTYGTVLHPHLTCGTRRLACYVYLWDHPTYGTRWLMCHVYLWNLSSSSSDLWDPMVCVSLVVAGV